jgi:hypothetical protein
MHYKLSVCEKYPLSNLINYKYIGMDHTHVNYKNTSGNNEK